VLSTPAPAEKYFTLGDFPVRVAGMKVYHTADETCILETPVVWGSNAAVRGGPWGSLGLSKPCWGWCLEHPNRPQEHCCHYLSWLLIPYLDPTGRVLASSLPMLPLPSHSSIQSR